LNEMANITVEVMQVNNPRWWIGGYENAPALCVSLPTAVRNDRYARIKLVSAWIKGTEGIRFIDPLIIEGHRQEMLFIGAMMRPVISEEDKNLTGEVVFLDGDGETHEAGTVTFEAPPKGCQRRVPDSPRSCVFCSKQIARERYYAATFAGAAHDTCIWPHLG
jgi:hypothetical protein